MCRRTPGSPGLRPPRTRTRKLATVSEPPPMSQLGWSGSVIWWMWPSWMPGMAIHPTTRLGDRQRAPRMVACPLLRPPGGVFWDKVLESTSRLLRRACHRRQRASARGQSRRSHAQARPDRDRCPERVLRWRRPSDHRPVSDTESGEHRAGDGQGDRAGHPDGVVRHTEHDPDAGMFRAGSHAWLLRREVDERPRGHLVEKSLPGSFTDTSLGRHPRVERHRYRVDRRIHDAHVRRHDGP